jgi:hypothetical protein
VKTNLRGYTVDTRTAAMFLWAEKRAGFTLHVTQGSYNTGVGASAGTHDGGGALDLSVHGMTPARINVVLKALKDAGFATWHRHAIAGVWPEHIHAVAIGCKDLAPVAERQVAAYLSGHDGMKLNEHDRSYRPVPQTVWSVVSNRPVKLNINNK